MAQYHLPKVGMWVRFPLAAHHAEVAQLAERRFRKAEVVGSTPTLGSMRRNYSRLATVEEKKNLRKALLFAFLSLIFIIFLFFLGIPLFAKFATFMSNLGKSDKPIVLNDTTPPAPPQLFVENEYTNQKSVEISGNTEAGAIAIVTFNSKEQELISDKDGAFSFKFGLRDGENSFFARAKDQAGNVSQPTKTYKITFDSTPPEIIIESPTDGSEYFGSKQTQVTIKGQTEIGSSVTLNDRFASVSDSGTFNFTASLSEGENIFNIKAVDKAGNEKEKSLTLRFTP